jgi:hypothetical protein
MVKTTIQASLVREEYASCAYLFGAFPCLPDYLRFRRDLYLFAFNNSYYSRDGIGLGDCPCGTVDVASLPSFNYQCWVIRPEATCSGPCHTVPVKKGRLESGLLACDAGASQAIVVSVLVDPADVIAPPALCTASGGVVSSTGGCPTTMEQRIFGTFCGTNYLRFLVEAATAGLEFQSSLSSACTGVWATTPPSSPPPLQCGFELAFTVTIELNPP